jgi:hypothetical protein
MGLTAAPQLPLPVENARHRKLPRMVQIDQIERRQRSLSLGIIALQTSHALAYLRKAVVPTVALEQMPKSMRIEDADVPAHTGHLHRMMPAGDVEKVFDGVYERPTHDSTKENINGTYGKARFESEMKNGRADEKRARLYRDRALHAPSRRRVRARMTSLLGHNGPSEAERIADYLEGKAQRFNDRAGRTGDAELRARGTMLNAAASDIRARLFED